MVEDFYKWFMSEPEQDYSHRKDGQESPVDGDVDYEMYYKSNSPRTVDNCVTVDLFRYSGSYKCWCFISVHYDSLYFSLTDKYADEVSFEIYDFITPELTDSEIFQSSLVQDLPPVSLKDLRMLIKVARRLQIEDNN